MCCERENNYFFDIEKLKIKKSEDNERCALVDVDSTPSDCYDDFK